MLNTTNNDSTSAIYSNLTIDNVLNHNIRSNQSGCLCNRVVNFFSFENKNDAHIVKWVSSVQPCSNSLSNKTIINSTLSESTLSNHFNDNFENFESIKQEIIQYDFVNFSKFICSNIIIAERSLGIIISNLPKVNEINLEDLNVSGEGELNYNSGLFHDLFNCLTIISESNTSSSKFAVDILTKELINKKTLKEVFKDIERDKFKFFRQNIIDYYQSIEDLVPKLKILQTNLYKEIYSSIKHQVSKDDDSLVASERFKCREDLSFMQKFKNYFHIG